MKNIIALCVQKSQPDEQGIIKARLRLKNKKLVSIWWLDNLSPNYDNKSGQYFLENSLITGHITLDNRLTNVRTIQVTERLTDRLIYGKLEAKLKAMRTRKVIFK